MERALRALYFIRLQLNRDVMWPKRPAIVQCAPSGGNRLRAGVRLTKRLPNLGTGAAAARTSPSHYQL
jgi:hypothetical protein